MRCLELKGTHNVPLPGTSSLILRYYLVTSDYQNVPIYGIQIQSQCNNNSNIVHSETIPHLSYSISYVNTLIEYCKYYYVTPTDMLSALDCLMNTAC